ncbi:lipocalin family protein [Neptuniibacter pectenicola]|uniref:Outer membrane lipoprotein Blc n=1 Tax=Neptuniibacter pectenicola TaxID=1806669 RepID=A0ABU9TS61_9GAMM
MRYFWTVLLFSLTGCVGIPEGIEPVRNFDSKRYLGIWYEVARLDHSFERGLEQVTAEYSMRNDGGIKVVNRGFNTESYIWEEAEAKAYFVNENNIAHLKVSFFGPFYGSYIIFDLGIDYEYALVTSTSKSYFWLLSRSTTIDNKLKIDLIRRIEKLGFETEDMIFVNQSYEFNRDQIDRD